jgi:hypothetical protein
MSQNASEKTPRICSQNNIAEASFSAWPLRFVKAPASMELGMDCCKRSTNRNILSLGGRNPNLSAVITTTNPMGCTKNSLVNVIAIVDRTPKCELPDPAIQFSNFSCLRPNSVVAYIHVYFSDWQSTLAIE